MGLDSCALPLALVPVPEFLVCHLTRPLPSLISEETQQQRSLHPAIVLPTYLSDPEATDANRSHTPLVLLSPNKAFRRPLQTLLREP